MAIKGAILSHVHIRPWLWSNYNPIKVPMTWNFLLSYSKELSKWRGVAFILLWLSTLGCLVIQDFDLTMWTQSGVKSPKNKCLTTFFCVELKQLLHSHKVPWYVHCDNFHGNTMGSRPSPFKRENQSFPPSRSVICSCSFSVCEQMWTSHSTSTRKSVILWSNK